MVLFKTNFFTLRMVQCFNITFRFCVSVAYTLVKERHKKIPPAHRGDCSLIYLLPISFNYLTKITASRLPGGVTILTDQGFNFSISSYLCNNDREHATFLCIVYIDKVLSVG